jgi:hypothetical protein
VQRLAISAAEKQAAYSQAAAYEFEVPIDNGGPHHLHRPGSALYRQTTAFFMDIWHRRTPF